MLTFVLVLYRLQHGYPGNSGSFKILMLFFKGGKRMGASNILIVDDEEQLRSLLRLYLEPEGFQIDEAVDGKEALIMAQQTDYDVIILDLMMPGLDGWEVCRKLRKDQNDTSVLMLTAKTEVEDKLVGFDLGADDYMGKPFDPRELVARVHALLRRRNTDASYKDKVISFHDLKINQSARTALADEKRIPLTAKEFDLLWLMANHKGRVFSRDQLLQLIWGEHFLGESRTVDSHVKNLRDKLNNAGLDHMIYTVWGVGYKLDI
jgi:two-component system response regulator ResD